ncbi:MAG TPA: serine/threonine protein kinase [Steroidobacteraceae bacterium]|jgi:Ser/Thr protein kinase RdoA (MazF antagonist)|nr:serine/threonine protein kinase [Steroidobacteraceae bacterium]
MINRKSGSGAGETVARPFEALSPDVVLDAAASVGIEGDGRLLALNSYENRVYQLGTDAGNLVLKFYRAGRWSDAQITEEHEFTAEMAAAELPVAAPLQIQGATLFRYQDYRFCAFPWMPGRAPELDAAQSLTLLGRAIARVHQIGCVRPFRVRPRLSAQRLGWEARESVLASELMPQDLSARYEEVSGELLEAVEGIFESAGEGVAIRIHGDCHLGNLLWNERGPVFVDLDDCMMGPRVQDLWMLLSGTPAEQQRQWAEILEGYQQFANFDYREVLLVEALRSLRMLHHAAWVAQRWRDPAFPRAFPWFGERRNWENYVLDLMEQSSNMREQPLLQ